MFHPKHIFGLPDHFRGTYFNYQEWVAGIDFCICLYLTNRTKISENTENLFFVLLSVK